MKLKKIATVIFIFSVVVIILYFLFRNTILNYALHRMQDKVKSKYNTELKITKAYFSGFSTVNANEISVIPPGNDTLAVIKHIEADLSFFRILTNKLPYKK